jgi:ABC-2 type transport system permease protein
MTASGPTSVPQPPTTRRVSRFIVIVVYTFRSCFPRKRWAAILVPCAGALLFGLLAHAVHEHAQQGFVFSPTNPLIPNGPLTFARPDRIFNPAQRAFARVAADGIFGLVMPIAALVIGDSVLGAEVRAGTFHFTWLTPTPTWEIVLGRWAAGSIVALATIAPACALAAVVAGTPESAFAAFVAAAVGSAAYIAVFIAIAVLTRRTAVWSLTFVFLVERLLGSALTGIAQLSPTWESRATFVGLLKDVPSDVVRKGIPQGGAAVVRLLIVAAVFLGIAIWRMSHMRMAGATD